MTSRLAKPSAVSTKTAVTGAILLRRDDGFGSGDRTGDHSGGAPRGTESVLVPAAEAAEAAESLLLPAVRDLLPSGRSGHRGVVNFEFLNDSEDDGGATSEGKAPHSQPPAQQAKERKGGMEEEEEPLSPLTPGTPHLTAIGKRRYEQERKEHEQRQSSYPRRWRRSLSFRGTACRGGGGGDNDDDDDDDDDNADSELTSSSSYMMTVSSSSTDPGPCSGCIWLGIGTPSLLPVRLPLRPLFAAESSGPGP